MARPEGPCVGLTQIRASVHRRHRRSRRRLAAEHGVVWGLDGAVRYQLASLDPTALAQFPQAIVDGRAVGQEEESNAANVPVEWDENGVPTASAHDRDANAAALNHSDVIGGFEGSEPAMWWHGRLVRLPDPRGTLAGNVTAVGDDDTLGGFAVTVQDTLPVLWTCTELRTAPHRPV